MRHLIKKILREEFSKEKLVETRKNRKNLLTESNNTQINPNFNEIYNELWDKMLNQVCLRYTNDVNKAQDYCQNGFMKVLSNLSKYDGKGSLEGWVRRVIRNNILDEMRKKKMEFTNDEPDWSRFDKNLENEPYSEDKMYNVEMIKSVLPNLSPKFRKVFELYHFQNKNHQEIANLLGISVGTSKSNLSRAKSKVLKMVKSEFGV